MSNLTKKIILLLAVIASSAFITFSLAPKTSLAFDLFGNTCKNDNTPTDSNGAKSDVCASNQNASGASNSNNAALNAIQAAANIIAFVAGVAAVIVIIISGFSLVTSGGNSEQVGKARSRIINAAVGLVIVALAYTITRFIIQNVVK